MKNAKRIVLICQLLLSGIFLSMNAQNPEIHLPRCAVSFEPLYLLNSGLRVNFEYRSTAEHAFELSLIPYYAKEIDEDTHDDLTIHHVNVNSGFREFNSLSGLGTGLGYKYYFASLFFINPNISYTRYNVKYEGWEFKQFKEDGLTYYSYEQTLIKQPFDKFTVCMTLGGRSSYRHAFFVEYYAGIGLAHSIYDINKKKYNESMFGYGYSGIYLSTGIKIAFSIQ
ncbi:MAG: hypothetical protein LBH32_03690 [Dysgonamonadaceae bacterium]|jgi:hypothetical protein|nr:hypothetical protein [Dysgonamonadaceae bacterium]